jgi:hypothetical protein
MLLCRPDKYLAQCKINTAKIQYTTIKYKIKNMGISHRKLANLVSDEP